MKQTNYLKLIGSLLVAVLMAGCAAQPVVFDDRQAEVVQHPAPGCRTTRPQRAPPCGLLAALLVEEADHGRSLRVDLPLGWPLADSE